MELLRRFIGRTLIGGCRCWSERSCFPSPADRLWEALTEPESVSGWFGADVEWDLKPGGRARFVSADEGDRRGLIDDVSPGRHLRFRWWPESDEDEVSEVSYQLDPDDAGTRLKVTERRVAPAAHNALAHASAGTTGGWDAWDDRLASLWAGAGAAAAAPRPLPVPMLVSGGRVGLIGQSGPVSTLDPDVAFAALGDPTRRHLLDDLSRRGPLTATQLARAYPGLRQAVVKHLAALASAGLLVSERHGREVRYRVDSDAIGDAARWLAEVGTRWDHRLAALQKQLE